jgi:hypothetical protein
VSLYALTAAVRGSWPAGPRPPAGVRQPGGAGGPQAAARPAAARTAALEDVKKLLASTSLRHVSSLGEWSHQRGDRLIAIA